MATHSLEARAIDQFTISSPFTICQSIAGRPDNMFCLLVSPDPLRRTLLSDPEPRSPSYTKVVVGLEDGDDYEDRHTPPPVAHYVAVDIPDDDSDVDDLECRAPPISPARRVFVKALFVVYTVFMAPALVGTAVTRSVSYPQALLVIVPTALTVMALFMAVMCVMDAEKEEDDDEGTS